MSTKNNLNNHASQMTIDPGASGDSAIQFDINTTGEFIIGVDDTASDAFKISQGSALGTSDTFVMTAAGERTMPLEPAFGGVQQSTANNVTGNGAVYTLGATVAFTERFDQNTDFNTNGTFTAPVEGKYHFSFHLAGSIALSAANGTEMLAKIVTSNKTYTVYTAPTRNKVTNFIASNNFVMLFGSIVCEMEATDTCTVTITDTGGSGDNDDIYGDASNAWTAFSGQLVC